MLSIIPAVITPTHEAVIAHTHTHTRCEGHLSGLNTWTLKGNECSATSGQWSHCPSRSDLSLTHSAIGGLSQSRAALAPVTLSMHPVAVRFLSFSLSLFLSLPLSLSFLELALVRPYFKSQRNKIKKSKDELAHFCKLARVSRAPRRSDGSPDAPLCPVAAKQWRI